MMNEQNNQEHESFMKVMDRNDDAWRACLVAGQITAMVIPFSFIVSLFIKSVDVFFMMGWGFPFWWTVLIMGTGLISLTWTVYGLQLFNDGLKVFDLRRAMFKALNAYWSDLEHFADSYMGRATIVDAPQVDVYKPDEIETPMRLRLRDGTTKLLSRGGRQADQPKLIAPTSQAATIYDIPQGQTARQFFKTLDIGQVEAEPEPDPQPRLLAPTLINLPDGMTVDRRDILRVIEGVFDHDIPATAREWGNRLGNRATKGETARTIQRSIFGYLAMHGVLENEGSRYFKNELYSNSEQVIEALKI